MNYKSIAKNLREQMGYPQRNKVNSFESEFLLNKIMSTFGGGSPEYQVAYGILWALKSGRVDGVLDQAITRYMKPTDVLDLVAKMIKEKCDIGDVPKWLNANYRDIGKFTPFV